MHASGSSTSILFPDLHIILEHKHVSARNSILKSQAVRMLKLDDSTYLERTRLQNPILEWYWAS